MLHAVEDDSDEEAVQRPMTPASTLRSTLTRIETAPTQFPKMHEIQSVMGRQPRGTSIRDSTVYGRPFTVDYLAPTRHHHANGNFKYRTPNDDLRCNCNALPPTHEPFPLQR